VHPLRAQQPTPAQAQEMLRTRPELVSQLRTRLASSGLTPDQVRARLRAAGYPESMLDAYLPGSSGAAATAPGDSVFAAVRQLGLADSLDFLPAPRDSARAAPMEDGLPIFGLDVFRGSTSQFTPVLAGPVDANYRLGPGDVLVLILTGDVELAHTLEVTREGFVVVPQVGQLYVANLTMDGLEDLFYARLGRVYSGVRRGGGSTRFSVSVARLHSNQVFVVGDVEMPGSYQVSGAGTVLTALYAAGGPSANGSLRKVEVRRAGTLVGTLDVYDYLLRGDASKDVRLQNGDVVFVPVHGPRVRVEGEVVRPAVYELKSGETLNDAVHAAGGFTPAAARRRIQVTRILPPSQRGADGGRARVVIDVASDQLLNGDAPALPLEPGDGVQVFAVAEEVRDRIVVKGNVWAPGTQGYRDGMRLSDAVRLAGGVRPDVYLGQVLITRTRPDSSRVQLRSAFRDTTGAVTDDLVLEERDEIEIFSVAAFRTDRWVAIGGAVNKGGRFAWREGMTMRDLVLLAGGLREFAYLKEAEIARLPQERGNGRLATTIRIPLDSSYLFERGADGKYEGPPGLPAPADGSVDVTLEPYDNVMIMRQPDWELQRTVVLLGEVQFPGRYALLSKTERLSDVLTRAGGLTSEAYADGVVFWRREDRTGRVGIDLPRVLKDPRSLDNLILQDGDSIVVPEFNPVVKVQGAVNSPVGVSYVEGASLDYYVRAAGGPSRVADLKRAYVKQPNGKVEAVKRRVMLPDGVPEPRAGAVVFVPERDPEDKRDYVAAAGAVAQVLAAIVGIVAIATR
jgi:protein involved in polysaccharide export with SLBB domain